MPHSVMGFGKRYYGKRDFLADGSYTTTEWITYAYFPLIPLGSVRVLREGEIRYQGTLGGVNSTRDLIVREMSTRNAKQVRATCAFAVGCLGWGALTFVALPRNFSEDQFVVYLVTAAVPLAFTMAVWKWKRRLAVRPGGRNPTI